MKELMRNWEATIDYIWELDRVTPGDAKEMLTQTDLAQSLLTNYF